MIMNVVQMMNLVEPVNIIDANEDHVYMYWALYGLVWKWGGGILYK